MAESKAAKRSTREPQRHLVVGFAERMTDPDDSLSNELLGGRYQLEAALGHGGMGVVYRALDLTMKRLVAVKLVRSEDGVELDEELVGRFLREARNTARVQHEHIVEVFDVGRSQAGDLFFVMELLEGESLSARLRRVGRLSPEETVYIGRQICSALHVAHVAGIIHRDLKPANVMLVPRAGMSDFVKVLDFGVAKSYSPDQQTQLTHTGMLVGTVDYMAPEQILGRQVDGRTDVYALGVVLYRMLSGAQPFRDGGVPALIHAHLNQTPASICTLTRDVPAALDAVVLRCLAKRPEQRFATMADLGNALEAALEPSSAQLTDLEYRGADDDPYAAGGDHTAVAQTAIARSPRAIPQYDEATRRIERPAPAVPLGSGSGRAAFAEDQTAVLPREAPNQRPPREEGLPDRDGPKECAMCRTVNMPHARACSACGVSLANQDQDAVRARVKVPTGPHLVAHGQMPPISGGFPAGRPPPWAGTPAHGVAWAAGVPPETPPRAPSMWQRFLVWTGLRAR